MAFAFAVLFEGVLDVDGFVHQVLAVHGLDRLVGRFERVVRDEAVAERLTRREVALDLGVQLKSISVLRNTGSIRPRRTFAVCTSVPNAVKVS